MGIGRSGGLLREENCESARGFHWYNFPKTDTLGPPLPPLTSYLINTHTHAPIPVYREAGWGGGQLYHAHDERIFCPVHVFLLLFVCYLYAAHKGTSIYLCKSKLFFCVSRMHVHVPCSTAGNPSSLILSVDIFHHSHFFLSSPSPDLQWPHRHLQY